MILMPLMSTIKKWAASAMRIKPWEYILSMTRMTTGLRSFLRENKGKSAIQRGWHYKHRPIARVELFSKSAIPVVKSVSLSKTSQSLIASTSILLYFEPFT